MELEKAKVRPDVREQTLRHGITYPTDEELLMLILGSGTKDVSVRNLARSIVRTLNGTNSEDVVKNLLRIKGMGAGKALAVAASLEFGRRRNSYKNAVVRSPKDVVPFVRNYSMQPREHFLCVTLNGGHEILQIRVASVGTVNQTIVHPREIFSEALMEHAAAIIVCHNHPSGNCEPSEEDIETTELLIRAADILGISLLDHIIIDCNSYFSFLEHNLLFSVEYDE
ncbi:MAG: DNA repair protein RadC [Treponemataceae bacterium]|nr:DNA repair protein RadC [Treponemataceae bacterium]